MENLNCSNGLSNGLSNDLRWNNPIGGDGGGDNGEEGFTLPWRGSEVKDDEGKQPR